VLPDGKTILTPCGEGWVRVWDAATGTEAEVPGRYRGTLYLTPSPDGKAVALGDLTGRIDLCDAVTGGLIRTLRAPDLDASQVGPASPATGRPTTAAARRQHWLWGERRFSPDGSLLAASVWSPPGATGPVGGVHLIRTADGADIGRVASGWDVPVGFTPDGKGVVVHSNGGEFAAWDVATKQKVRTYIGSPSDPAGSPGAVSPDGRRLVVGHKGEAIFFDVTTGAELRRVRVYPANALRPNEGRVQFSWSGDGRTVACTLTGDVVVLLDPDTARERNRFTAIPANAPEDIRLRASAGKNIATAGLSPDGKWAFLGGRGLPLLWETATGKVLATIPVPLAAGLVSGVFTPDGRAVLTTGPGGIGYRWELADLLTQKPPKGTSEELWAAAAEGERVGKAVEAAFALVAREDGRKFLREKLRPAGADFTDAQVKQWVADLGSDSFRIREAAAKELAAHVRLVAPTLREAVRVAPDLEVRRRLEAILARLDRSPTTDELRAMRLVRATEMAGTAEARELLKGWAGGAAGAILTEDARAALGRIGRLATAERK
jgi:WD40 repeat protein